MIKSSESVAWREGGGILAILTIEGKEHKVAAHPAGERNPAKFPASAWCRECKSDRCAGCRRALELVKLKPA